MIEVDKIYFELEGGSIFTLRNISLKDNKGIDLKRKIKAITKIPIKYQKLFASKYEIKNTSRLLMYPIGSETILKVIINSL